jgi:putative tryptophan/tyrosine transport system substrate-binding protein
MRRREFITLVGGAASWPLAARAQQPDRMRRIGVLMNLAADDPESQRRVSAFVQALQQFDWIDGRNLQIEYRWGAGDAGIFSKHAVELVALAPDLILATGTPVMQALQQATRTVPIGSYSSQSLTRSAPALSRVWHGQEETRPASPCSNTG